MDVLAKIDFLHEALKRGIVASASRTTPDGEFVNNHVGQNGRRSLF